MNIYLNFTSRAFLFESEAENSKPRAGTSQLQTQSSEALPTGVQEAPFHKRTKAALNMRQSWGAEAGAEWAVQGVLSWWTKPLQGVPHLLTLRLHGRRQVGDSQHMTSWGRQSRYPRPTLQYHVPLLAPRPSSRFLLISSWEADDVAETESLLPMWETRTECPAPSFGPA